jgi:hypothetical protein
VGWEDLRWANINTDTFDYTYTNNLTAMQLQRP